MASSPQTTDGVDIGAELLKALAILDGEDDHTMGDPGQLGDTGRVRQELTELLEARAVDWQWDDLTVSFRAYEEEHEWLYAHLLAADQEQADALWLERLRALERVDQPLLELAPDDSRRLVAQAYSALNELSGRRSRLRDQARDRLLTDCLDLICARCPEPTPVLAGYTQALRAAPSGLS